MVDVFLSNEEINRLITCPKKITEKPTSEEREEGQHYRNDMKLISVDGSELFTVFFRRHRLFAESFSIGLAYVPIGIKRELIIFRCNGQHGSTIFGHHNSCHIHRVTEEILRQGCKSESAIEVTTAYNCYERGVIYFAKQCNISGRCDYIDNFRQLSVLMPCLQKPV